MIKKINNPYEGISALAQAGLTQGMMAYDAFRNYRQPLMEAPSIDDGSLFLDTSFFKNNQAQAQGLRSDAKNDVWTNVLQGAGSGAIGGSAFGPVGTAIGGIAGGIGGLASGLISSGRKKKEARRVERESNDRLSNYLSSFNRANEARAYERSAADRMNSLYY